MGRSYRTYALAGVETLHDAISATQMYMGGVALYGLYTGVSNAFQEQQTPAETNAGFSIVIGAAMLTALAEFSRYPLHDWARRLHRS